jgi:peptidyl-prolyl cis-trans isomerase D
MPDFFKNHIDDYRLPEKMRVRYLRFDPKDHLSDIEVSDQEIKERYEASQDRWKVSRQALARHILLSTTEEEDPKARMKVFQKAESILKRAQGGEDFTKLAREYSDEPETASQGGLMGWKRPGELPEELDKALFQELTPGQLSDRPIKSPAGFHILKLDEIRSERMRELDEVKAQLVTEIRNDKASQNASEQADKAYLAIFQGAPFKEASEEFKVSLNQTPYFSMNETSDEIPGGLAFREAAFELKEQDDFSEVIEDGGLFFVIEFVERQPSRAPEMNEVQDRVREDLKRDKAQELAKAEAGEIIKRIQKKEQTLAEIAEGSNWPLVVSPTLGRLFQAGGLPPDLVKAAFALHEDQTLLQEPYSSGDQVLVAEVKERIPADPAGLKEQSELYRSILLREKRESSFRNWLEMLRANSEIKTSKTFQELL